MSLFSQIATIYCSGGKQLSKQASLATPLLTGTAILHTEKENKNSRTAPVEKNDFFFVLF